MNPSKLAVSDKVVLTSSVRVRRCFKPVPKVGQVYVVRDVVETSDGIQRIERRALAKVREKLVEDIGEAAMAREWEGLLTTFQSVS